MIKPPSPSVRRRRARRGEGALLREELVEAAEALLLDLGDAGELTIREVAAKVGVTSPSVYLHFADKEALVDAVCLRAWDALALRMSEASEQSDDPFQALRSLGAAYIRWALDHSLQYQLLLLTPRRELRSARTAAAEACLRHLTEAVEPCVEAGLMYGNPEQLTPSDQRKRHRRRGLVPAKPRISIGSQAARVFAATKMASTPDCPGAPWPGVWPGARAVRS